MIEIVGTIIIIFLAGLCWKLNLELHKTIIPEYDGNIIVTELEDKKIFSLELHGNPDELDQKEVVIFRVVPTEPSIEE